MNEVKLINQNDYEDVIYITRTQTDDAEKGLHTTIKSSGCGICTGMMVAQFFGEELTLEDAIQMSYDSNANIKAGTLYKQYSEALCKKFDLSYSRTYNKDEILKCLDDGGCVVCNVGGDHDNHLGIFSHIGHYIFILKHNGDDVYILDPGMEPHKYEEEHRVDKVRVDGDFVISNIQNVIDDSQNRELPFYLYRKMRCAYFAGGCFWCVTPVFKELNGVKDVVCGYSGGSEINPTYNDVKAQKTGHRETIKVIYDDNAISYKELLEVFLSNVDIYDGTGQYIDKGFSYTLAIFYNDNYEKDIVTNRLNQYQEKVFIDVVRFSSFYDAEEYHQNYYLKNKEAFEEEMINSGRKHK